MTIKPIALTIGEPAGVGPELAIKAWHSLSETVPFFLIGDPRHMPGDAQIAIIDDASEAMNASASGLPMLRHAFADTVEPGTPSDANAQGVIDVIARAVNLVQTGQASAICTNPINKHVLQRGAGFGFPGHTEYLAHLGGVERSVMMLASDELRVVPVTIHIALDQVANSLTGELLADTIRITDAALQRDFGIKTPRIAVAGLNPHAGEGGSMGRQEIDLITPVLDELRAEGMDITGPHSADTMFHGAARETYDVAICMYHDQALIPIKTLAFDKGVNVTLGLPFVRTSPDHGTAFDIAGQGVANPSSLIEALKMAAKMAVARV